MSSPTVAEAKRFSTPAVPDHVVYRCRPRSDFFRALPFFPVEGYEYRALVADANCSTGLSGFADAVAAGGTLDATMPAINEQVFEFSRIAKQVPIDSLLPEYGSQVDLSAALTRVGVEAVRDEFKRLAIRGDKGTTPAEFDGLRIIGSNHSVGANGDAANGGALLVRDVYRALEELDSRANPRNTFLVGNQAALTHMRANNFTDLEYVQYPSGLLPVVGGVPFLVDNFVPVDESKGTGSGLTSLYAVVLDGQRGVHGGYPSSNEGQPIQIRGPVVKENTDTQWLHVSFSATLVAVNRSVVRIDGIDWSL